MRGVRSHGRGNSHPRRHQERHCWQGWGLACGPLWVSGTCPCWEERSRDTAGLPGEAEPGGPAAGGRRLVHGTAQAAGEQSAHYKYISGVNAREEKSYFS